MKKDIGDVTILVNNAGVITAADFLSTQDHQIERMFEVNILGHMWVRSAWLQFFESVTEEAYSDQPLLAVNYQMNSRQCNPSRLCAGKLEWPLADVSWLVTASSAACTGLCQRCHGADRVGGFQQYLFVAEEKRSHWLTSGLLNVLGVRPCQHFC